MHACDPSVRELETRGSLGSQLGSLAQEVSFWSMSDSESRWEVYLRVTLEVEVVLWFPFTYTYMCTYLYIHMYVYFNTSMQTNTPVHTLAHGH